MEREDCKSPTLVAMPELKRILHEDDVESLLIQLELAKPLSLSQILQLSIEQLGEDASTADCIQCGRSDFTSFLIAHSTLLEVAACTLALNCVTHLIGELQAADSAATAAAALHQALGESVVPLHCLIVKLFTLRGDAAFEDRAVRFVRTLSAAQPRFFRVCAEREAFGHNALELAVSLQLFSLAECILESDKYCGEVSLVAGVKVQRVDLSEYDFDTGDRYNKSPLNMLAFMTMNDLSDPLKKFLDHRIVTEWSRRMSDRIRNPMLARAVVCTIYKMIIILFAPANIYTTVTVKRFEMSDNSSSCPLFGLHLKWKSICALAPVQAAMCVSLVAFSIECLLILASNFAFAKSLTAYKSYFETLPDFMRRKSQIPIRMAIVMLTIIMSYFVTKVKSNPESMVPTNESRPHQLIALDYATCAIYALTALTMVYDWMLVIEKMVLLWDVMGIFTFFVIIIFMAMSLFCWLISLIVPCDPIFDSRMSSEISYTILTFYLLLSNGGLSRSSVRTLGAVFLVTHVLIVLFCFNFLIALLSQRLSVTTDNLHHVCMAYRLHTIHFFRMLWRNLRKAICIARACSAKKQDGRDSSPWSFCLIVD